ncbi:galactose-3-O-sulfotransferase 2-like [Diadema antillarum]|uniref:galactose-3-O-sulfotransferase 2-like n=1 Tax=Diadema antillarum TaxID=105358 RepID=UPI003A8B0209
MALLSILCALTSFAASWYTSTVILHVAPPTGHERIRPYRSGQAEPVHPTKPQRVDPITTLGFIKTHKTGSTTVGNILNRYAYSRNLSFLMYRYDRNRVGQFLQHIPSNRKELLPPLGVKFGDYDNYTNYDFMTAHSRFLPSLEFFRRFMKPGARFVTILRDPVDQWESSFFFFKCDHRFHGENGSQKIDDFFRNAAESMRRLRSNCFFYLRNGMWFDITDDKAIHTDRRTINETLRTLDKELDLVLILEYLDESLILLKEVMHWSFSDILYIRFNQRVVNSMVNERQRALIRDWNMADVLLYEHFNQTLWKRIAEYGSQFQSDLRHFRSMLSMYSEDCRFKNSTYKKVYRLTPVRNSSSLCHDLSEISYGTPVKRQSVGITLGRKALKNSSVYSH